MTRIRRLVVLLLVALALPIQALAAAAMLHCAPQGGAVAHLHGAGDEAQGHHGHPVADTGHAAPHVHDAHGPQSDAAGLADRAAANGHACSACAVCCTLAGVPVMALGVPAPEPLPAARPEPAAPAAVFLTSGVERPPRAHG